MYNKQIETFIHVADCGSFSKAAEALFLSSVAVMKQINALEQHLGFRLLDRTSQGVSLTAAGRLFYEDSKTIIAMSVRSVRRAREAAQIARNTIRIGTSLMRPHQALSEFQLNELPFQYRILPFSDETVSDLLSGPEGLGDRIDCCAGVYDPSLKNRCSVLHLKNVPYRIAVPSGHPLARKRLLSMEDLRGQTLWLMEPGHFSTTDALREKLETWHPEINIRNFPVSGDNIERFNECIRANGLMVSFDLWTDLHPCAVTLPVSWTAETTYGLIYSKNPSREVQEFVAELKKHLQK